MNRTGIACAVAAVALGAFIIGGAAYTGSRLEDTLKAQIAQQNTALQQVLPGSQISLNALQRGLFSSEARYDVVLDTPNDDLPAIQLTFSDHIEHGPLPMSRLGAFQWLPVMAVSHLSVEKTPNLQKWFDASGSTPPLSAITTINYSGNLSGSAHVAALQLKETERNLIFSGLTAQYELTNNGTQATVETAIKQLEINDNNGQLTLNNFNASLTGEGTHFEKFTIKGRINAINWQEKSDNQPVALRVNDTELLIQRARSASELYVGDGRLSIGTINASIPEKPAIALSNVVFSDNMQEANQHLTGNISYSLGNVAISDKSLGSLNLSLGYDNLNALHVRKIADIINNQDAHIAVGLNAQEEQALGTAVLGIIEDNPQLSINELLIKTTNGQSRFDLQVNLQKPTPSTKAPEEAFISAISALKSTLTISKPMIRDVVLWKGLLEPETPAELLAQESDQAVEMVSFLAAQSKLATLENDNIRSSLSYANKAINLNGEQMPLFQFLERIGAGAVLRK